MKLADPLPPDLFEPDGPDDSVDEIIDLTDRRRVFLHLVFGVRVPAASADGVFSRPR